MKEGGASVQRLSCLGSCDVLQSSGRLPRSTTLRLFFYPASSLFFFPPVRHGILSLTALLLPLPFYPSRPM